MICRLTASKESGESILVDGKKVALGIPGGGTVGPNTRVPNIPLARAATPDEAAKAVLLYVLPLLFVIADRHTDVISSLVSPLASYVSGHTLEVTGGAGI